MNFEAHDALQKKYVLPAWSTVAASLPVSTVMPQTGSLCAFVLDPNKPMLRVSAVPAVSPWLGLTRADS